MSKHNGICDHPDCRETAVHHGPQYSECVLHHAETITKQEVSRG